MKWLGAGPSSLLKSAIWFGVRVPSAQTMLRLIGIYAIVLTEKNSVSTVSSLFGGAASVSDGIVDGKNYLGWVVSAF